MKVANNFIEMIGNTTVVRLTKVVPPDIKAEIWCKCEFMNPSGSVKDRIAMYMIKAASLALLSCMLVTQHHIPHPLKPRSPERAWPII